MATFKLTVTGFEEVRQAAEAFIDAVSNIRFESKSEEENK